jgi:hypothetical protein
MTNRFLYPRDFHQNHHFQINFAASSSKPAMNRAVKINLLCRAIGSDRKMMNGRVAALPYKLLTK